MRLKVLSKLILAALLLVPVTAHAHTAQKDDLQIIHPWVETAQTGEATAAHMTFMNNAENRSFVITGASSPVAEEVVFVRTQTAENGKTVSVNRIVLTPGDIVDDQVILVKLKNINQNLKDGDIINMVLFFKDKTELPLRLGVGKTTMPE